MIMRLVTHVYAVQTGFGLLTSDDSRDYSISRDRLW